MRDNIWRRLLFWAQADSAHGYRIHSPFVFDFVWKVLPSFRRENPHFLIGYGAARRRKLAHFLGLMVEAYPNFSFETSGLQSRHILQAAYPPKVSPPVLPHSAGTFFFFLRTEQPLSPPHTHMVWDCYDFMLWVDNPDILCTQRYFFCI